MANSSWRTRDEDHSASLSRAPTVIPRGSSVMFESIALIGRIDEVFP
jgi:hypothetical protein